MATAPTLRGWSNASGGSGTASITKPSGLADGDWVIGLGYSESDTTPTFSGGTAWTHLYQANNFCVAWKYLEPGDATGEPASYTLTGVDQVIGSVSAVVGATPQFEGSDTTYDSTGDLAVAIPPLTSHDTDRLSFAAAMTFGGTSSGTFSGWSTGWVEQSDTGDGLAFAIDTVGSGSTGSLTCAPSDISNKQLGVHLLFAPKIPDPSDNGSWDLSIDFEQAGLTSGDGLDEYDATNWTDLATNHLNWGGGLNTGFGTNVQNDIFAIHDTWAGTDDYEILVGGYWGGDEMGTIHRHDGTQTATNEGFYIAVTTTTNIAAFDQENSQTFANVAHNISSLTDGDFIWVRTQVEGTAVRARAWRTGDAEPGTWQIDTTDADNAAGYPGMGLFGNSGELDSSLVVFAVQDLAATAGASGAPVPPMRANLVHMLTR